MRFMMITVKGITSLLSVAVAFHAPFATAVTYDVSASGDGMGLTEALELAQPGDSIYLADGIYDTALVSYRDGEVDNPITIEGSSDAIINGDYSSRSVLISHSFITLQGFTVEGKIGDGSDANSYIYKCIYVEGVDSELDGFVMEGMLVQNCGGECVRLKNNVINAEILDNTIQNCGIHDYEFESEDKNGEGIYIGTSSTQWVNDTPDNCIGNIVRGNTITTNGNECVDIKEGSTGNIVEENSCSDQLDTESGCYDVRGDNNIIRYNIAVNCMGAGVRLGGWDIDGYAHGQGNHVYGNDFSNCGVGSIKVETEGQGDICGNTCEGDNCSPLGSESGDITETWDKACNGNNSNSISTQVSGNSLSKTQSPSWEYDDGSTVTKEDDDGSTSIKYDDDGSAITVTEDNDDGSTISVTEDYDDGSTITKEEDDGSTVTEGYDDGSVITVTEDYDDESTVTKEDDDGSMVIEYNNDASVITIAEDNDDRSTISVTEDYDDGSTVTEDYDDGSTDTKEDDDGSTVTEDYDDGSTVTKEDDDGSTIIEYSNDGSAITVPEDNDDGSTISVTEDYDDGSTVTEDYDDGSTVTKEEDDGSTVTEGYDDESVITVTENYDDGSTVTKEDDNGSTSIEFYDDGSAITVTEDNDDGSFIIDYDDDKSTVAKEDDDDSSSSTTTATESYGNNDGDGNSRRRVRGSRV